MKILSWSCFENFLAKVPTHRLRPQARISRNFERVNGRTLARFCPTLEILEDRTTPSLIANQILPVAFPTAPPVPAATTNTVTILAPALSTSSPTPQQITLTDTIAGAPSGGTVTFTLPGGGTVTAPVVSGVAQVVNFTIPAGTLAGPVIATYSGTTGFAGSTSSGAGNGTLTFCLDNNSTLLGTTLQTFAVLAGSTVTNATVTGPSTFIVGNVGVSPGLATTGFTTDAPPGSGLVTGGTIHRGDALAATAQAELTTAYNAAAALPLTQDLTGQDLGGLILVPGVYFFASTAQLTGTLTLNNQGNPNAQFVFQIGSSLTTASGSRVLFINGGADNVYWQVGITATLGSSTEFAGNILALTSIILDPTASIACGRALARNAEVTLIDNFIDPAPPGATVVPAKLAIGKAVTTTALTSSSVLASGPAYQSKYGEAITFTAVVSSATSSTPAFGATSYTDAVGAPLTFYIANSTMWAGFVPVRGTVHLASTTANSATYTITTSLLPPSVTPYQVQAYYLGNANFAATPTPQITAQPGAVLFQKVAPAVTTTMVTSSLPAGAAVGQAVTYTAVVTAATGGKPSFDPVYFYDNGSAIPIGYGKIISSTANSQTYAFATRSLGLGTHSIKAAFTPSSPNFATSFGTVNQMVAPAQTRTVLTAAPTSGSANAATTFTATISYAAGYAGTLITGGTVTFKDGATTLGLGTYVGYTATTVIFRYTVAANSLSIGSHTISATYSSINLNIAGSSAITDGIYNGAAFNLPLTV